MLSKIMAISLGPHKIRVNVVSPGVVETDMMHGLLQSFKERNQMDCINQFHTLLEQETPSRQALTPMEDVVNTIIFMAGDSAKQITGQILGVDGGLSVS